MLRFAARRDARTKAGVVAAEGKTANPLCVSLYSVTVRRMPPAYHGRRAAAPAIACAAAQRMQSKSHAQQQQSL